MWHIFYYSKTYSESDNTMTHVRLRLYRIWVRTKYWNEADNYNLSEAVHPCFKCSYPNLGENSRPVNVMTFDSSVTFESLCDEL